MTTMCFLHLCAGTNCTGGGTLKKEQFPRVSEGMFTVSKGEGLSSTAFYCKSPLAQHTKTKCRSVATLSLTLKPWLPPHQLFFKQTSNHHESLQYAFRSDSSDRMGVTSWCISLALKLVRSVSCLRSFFSLHSTDTFA